MELNRIISLLESPALDYGLVVIVGIIMILSLVWLLQGGPA